MNIVVVPISSDIQGIKKILTLSNPLDDWNTPEEFINFRTKYSLKPIDECWIVALLNVDEKKIEQIAENYHIKIKVFKSSNINDILSQGSFDIFKSFIFRIVFNASQRADYLYLTSEMNNCYGIVQEAADIFGCTAMYYLDGATQKPLMIKQNLPASLIVMANADRLRAEDYPLDVPESDAPITISTLIEDKRLLKEVDIRRRQSIHLYSNFYGMIKPFGSERDIFRKLYYLPETILQKLKNYKLGEYRERDEWIISHFPKAELHSHIGGLLSPAEIIRVAEKVKDYKPNDSNSASLCFKRIIDEILKYENNPIRFENLIYGEYLSKENFKAIGIDKYQHLGDYQGSSILQLKETIQAALDIYAGHLILENIKYIELRCSPYKYTKLGLDIKEVVETIIDTLDKYSNSFDYRLIYIIGRQASKEEIHKAINSYCHLYDTNSKFMQKFVGIDVAGNEGATKPSELRADFMPLLERCAKITIHAGETEDVGSIWEAVYHLSADRIGHGLKLQEKPEFLSRFIDKKIGVEMCPTSNDQIVGFTPGEYPLLDYLRKGLRVSLNTDDCGISRTSLTNEYLKAAEMCPGLTLWDCIVLIRNSLCIAFCDEETRGNLMHSFENEILEMFEDVFEVLE